MRDQSQRLLLIGLAAIAMLNTSLAGWELLQNSPTTNDLHSVFFLDDNTGWITGANSTIYKTTNSGLSWVQQSSPEASNFRCIIFVDANTGWACGTGGTVVKTTNGGTNWFSQTFTASNFNSMDFTVGISGYTGYIAGDNGNIRKTTDGGSTWTSQVSGVNQNLHRIRFLIDGITGFAVGDNAIILKTANGGNSWEMQSGPGIGSQVFYAMDRFDAYNLESIVATGTITRFSIDVGSSWSLGAFPVEVLNSVTCVEGRDTYSGVGANGYIVKTDSRGGVWTPELSPTNQHLYSVHHPAGSNFIWAVGANGAIVRDTRKWVRETVPTSSSLLGICVTNVSTAYVVGNLGTILKTTNSGASWQTLSAGTSDRLTSVYFTDAQTGYVVGDWGTILKTTNSGTSWEGLPGASGYELSSVYFTDTTTGYIVGSAGKMFKTTNSGNSWDTLSSGTVNWLSSVHFADANTGYAVGAQGTILKTTNGALPAYIGETELCIIG